MLFIGITGGVGAGKSEILNYLKNNYNCRILMADQIAHAQLEPGSESYQALRGLFGSDPVFAPDGKFDRNRLAEVLFSDKDKREKMNQIIHPAVKRYVNGEYQAEKEKGQIDFLVLEAALLIEDHYDEICDELWYIYASEGSRRERLRKSRGYSAEKIQHIFDSQLTDTEFRKHCDSVIDNDKDTITAFSQIDSVLAGKGMKKWVGHALS